jgi:hypothetical protein
MKVYAVVLDVHYESGSLVGMFADFESAAQFGKNHPCYAKAGYDLGVVPCEVGQEVDHHAQVVWL